MVITQVVVAVPIRREACSPLRVRWHDVHLRSSKLFSPRLADYLLGRTSVLIRRSGPLYHIRLNVYIRRDKTATLRVSFPIYHHILASIALSLRGTDALASPSIFHPNG